MAESLTVEKLQNELIVLLESLNAGGLPNSDSPLPDGRSTLTLKFLCGLCLIDAYGQPSYDFVNMLETRKLCRLDIVDTDKLGWKSARLTTPKGFVIFERS